MPLAITLANQGHDVTVIKRQMIPSPHPNIQIIRSDIHDLTRSSLPKQIDIAYYLIAADDYTETSYQYVYIHGLNHFNTIISPLLNGPALFTSSTSVYAQCDGSWVDENSPTTPTHFSGRIMLEAEQRFLQQGALHSCIRLSGIYGPNRCRIIQAVQQGGPLHHNYTNRIHQVDAVRALIHLGNRTELSPYYIVSDHTPAPYSTIYQYTQNLLGIAPSNVSVTATPTRGGNKRLLNTRLRKTGFTFTYPSYKEGIRALIQPTTPPDHEPR
jgi:nucleoside-diphosphate-sugar epimerase